MQDPQHHSQTRPLQIKGQCSQFPNRTQHDFTVHDSRYVKLYRVTDAGTWCGVKCPCVCVSGGSVCCGGVSCCGQGTCSDFLSGSFLDGLCDACGAVKAVPCGSSYDRCSCASQSVERFP